MDVEEYRAVVDRAFDGMLGIATELGPDRVNEVLRDVLAAAAR